ncbi:DegT/DnrJ/EryC1/StrS family aminotransferase [Halovenus salina]|uniref:DegT/DnrJ/EryC1/StrS family aminotransferase n=1 Tax=Halovenus salina TaxID=1510225 RepID=UPI0022609AA6|nr:DegT/DnrJ/EryC1/StrS family aminotransferase [Halovenus salina]
MIPIANPAIDEAEKERVLEVLESGMLADGPVVREFEDEFAAYCDAEHAVATSNGTTALHAAMEALGLGKGDRVVTTPFSFVASANAVQFTGAEPVFADINPETYNLDPDAVEETIQEHNGDVDAIMAVHLYGLPADVTRLAELAEEYDAYLIEDTAQAHGATVDGERVGSIGDVGCFSFYPTKNMTTGEGGMIVTDDVEIADAAAQFVNHGRTAKYGHAAVGHNFRMTSIAGALGLAQLDRLPDFTEARRTNAEQLTAGLADSWVTPPIEPDGRTHVYHQYTIRCEDRDGLQTHLDEHGIGSGVYYPQCIHEQPAYSEMSVEAPVAERAAEEVLSLPVHPNVRDADTQRIIEVITNYVE